MSAISDVTVNFPIYRQFGPIRKMVFKTYIFINSNLILQKLKTT